MLKNIQADAQAVFSNKCGSMTGKVATCISTLAQDVCTRGSLIVVFYFTDITDLFMFMAQVGGLRK